MKKLILAGVFIFGSIHCYGASMTEPRKIINIGCHNGDNSCFVTIEGGPVGPALCNNTSIRWDASTAPGKTQFSLLMAAYPAGKNVNSFILDTCFSSQPIYPTFGYSII